MNILLLAPHPFYQERGTPIAVDMLLGVLDRAGHTADVVTFHEGRDRHYKNIVVHRIRPWGRVANIRPGFSFKKIYCDFFLAMTAAGLLRRRKYDVVHAVEESVFMALLFKRLYKIPFIYDMDSLLSAQLTDRFPALGFLRSPLAWLESKPIKTALAVAPMCADLADAVRQYRQEGVVVIRDVSLIQADSNDADEAPDLRRELGLEGKLCVLYVGNLEAYQGIDLLLASFANVNRMRQEAHLVVIGGAQQDVEAYRRRTQASNLTDVVHFLGPRPVEHIGTYLAQADVLVSPRIKGVNTPMKIYSYLHSGTPVVATDLPTHTQVLNSDIAVLAPPQPAAFATALTGLLTDGERRREIGGRAAAHAEREYSYDRFVESVMKLYPPTGEADDPRAAAGP